MASHPAGTSRPRASEPWVKLHVGAGRRAGLRPNDLVGAITGETSLTGASIGSIQIADSYTTVEVPESAADAVVRALAAGTIRGRKVPVRRFLEREPKPADVGGYDQPGSQTRSCRAGPRPRRRSAPR